MRDTAEMLGLWETAMRKKGVSFPGNCMHADGARPIDKHIKTNIGFIRNWYQVLWLHQK